MLLAPALTELVTGSTTPTGFLHPIGFLFLLFGYSLPVLLLREWAVRYRLGFASLLLLGVAFGIYTEGLWAKTIVQPSGLPIRQFDGYGRFIGVNFPWALAISLYHSFAAVLMPIVVVQAWFPTVRHDFWVSKRSTALVAVTLVVVTTVYFFSPIKLAGQPLQFLILLILMATCVAGAAIFPKRRSLTWIDAPPKLRAFFLGISSFSAWLILPPIAEHQLPIPLFLTVFGGGIWFYVFALRRIGLSQSNLLLFASGFYMQSALLALVIGVVTGTIERAVTAVAIIVALLYVTRRVLRSSRNAGGAASPTA